MYLSKPNKNLIVLMLVLLLMSIGINACVSPSPYPPVDHAGKPWRIAYYEGGPWMDYVAFTTALINGLVESGWMSPLDLTAFEQTDDSSALWEYLSENTESEFLEFVPDAYWSANWEDDLRLENQQEAIARFNTGDIDLVIAAGTWAGLDLANNEHSVPTLVISTTDPIGAGIIISAKDSGYDHVIARCDPERFLRQAQLFYDITDFKNLGVIYEDTVEGRTYASLSDLETAAQKNGFVLHTCQVTDSNISFEETTVQVENCLKQLAPEIDAFWIADLRGFSLDNFPQILDPLMNGHVKTWSAENIELVQRGVLFAVDYGDLSGIGSWYANVVAQIFHGILPREIDQVFQADGELVINEETARRIGYGVPTALLKAADEVYQTIEGE